MDFTYNTPAGFRELANAIGNLDREAIAEELQRLKSDLIGGYQQEVLNDFLTDRVQHLASRDMEAFAHSLPQPTDRDTCEDRAAWVVTDLLEAGANPHGGNVATCEQPVVEALSKGNWLMVVALIKGGADPTSEMEQEVSVVSQMFDAPTGIVLTLLDHIPAPMFPSTLVHDLMTEKSSEDGKLFTMCERLTTMGFAVPTDGFTLMNLVGQGHAKTLGMMLDAGADPAFTTTSEVQTLFVDDTPKATLSNLGQAPASPARFTFKKPKPLERHRHRGYTALHHAAYTGHAAAAQRLIESGAPVTAVTDQGVTPLHLAVLQGQSGSLVQILINAGLSLDQPDHKGRTAFDWLKKGSTAERVLEQHLLGETVNSLGTGIDPKINRPRL